MQRRRRRGCGAAAGGERPARAPRRGGCACECARTAAGEPRRRAPTLAGAWLALLLAVQPTAALYHTASETLHWFSHRAAVLPDRITCAAGAAQRRRPLGVTRALAGPHGAAAAAAANPKPHPPLAPTHPRSYATLSDKATGATVPLATLGRPAGSPGAPRVLFVFGEHCREVITTEVGLWLGRLLIDDHSHVRAWPELHAALERAGERPGGGGGADAWPATLHAWARELLGNMTIQVGRGVEGWGWGWGGVGGGVVGVFALQGVRAAAAPAPRAPRLLCLTARGRPAAAPPPDRTHREPRGPPPRGGRPDVHAQDGGHQRRPQPELALCVDAHGRGEGGLKKQAGGDTCRSGAPGSPLRVQRPAPGPPAACPLPCARPPQPATSEQYGGPAPLSEPQTRLLKGVADASPLAAYVNVHSGEWAVYTPWDSKPAYAPDLPVSRS
jgi:hypothetical protein